MAILIRIITQQKQNWYFIAAASSLLFCMPTLSAPLLTSAEAVQLGLKNNYGIKLSQFQIEAATLDRQTGVAPFLPDLTASARQSGDLVNSNNQSTLGASLNAQLFAGFKDYHGYQQLKAKEMASKLASQSEIQSTLESILSGYYSLVRLKQGLAALNELLTASAVRAKLANAKLEIGAGTLLEQLQSLADLNADSSAYLNQQMAIREAKTRLNQMLVRPVDSDFEVTDSIPLLGIETISSLEADAVKNNLNLKAAKTRQQIAKQGLSTVVAGHWPSLNAGLDYSIAPWQSRRLASAQQNEGNWTYGISLSIPIFDRLQTRRAVGNARIDVRQEEIKYKQTETSVLADFAIAKQRHSLGLQQVAMEQRNLKAAELQAEAASERFKVGSWSALEYRDAQTRLLDARSRLIAARLTTKQAELVMQRLAGRMTSAYAEGQ